MITASHNPSCDNGIKLIDPDGGMLKASWEPVVMEFMECSQSDGSTWIAGHLDNPESESMCFSSCQTISSVTIFLSPNELGDRLFICDTEHEE